MAKEKQLIHAVVCAYPALGHIHPLLRLSTLLVEQGIRVTFVTTQFFCDRLRKRNEKLNSAAAAAAFQCQRRVEGCDVGEGYSLVKHKQETIVTVATAEKDDQEEALTKQGLRFFSTEKKGQDVLDETDPIEEGIIFEGLPDGLPADFDRISPSTQLSRAVDQLRPAFEELMHTLLHSQTFLVRPNLLILDAFLSWTEDVALALLIPRIIFWPMSLAIFTIFRNTNDLLERGINPFTGDLDTIPAQVVDFLPGLPALPTSYLPYRIKPVGGQDRRFLLYEKLAKQSVQLREASCILLNSADCLEGLLMEQLTSNTEAPVKLVGPLVSLPSLELQPTYFVKTAASEDVIEWLNTKAVSSVLYICLGSVVSWTKLQMEEVGLGLMTKQQTFLWVVRPWEMRQFLLPGLSSLGKVVEFAPQIRVLGHPAIGGFLSHCGWNSMLESLSMGVPILAWPHFLDQFTNCWYVVHVWKVGVELGVVRRGGMDEAVIDRYQFTRAVALLMEGNSGNLMRMRASSFKKSLQEQLQQNSSCADLKAFLLKLIADNSTM